MTSRTSRGDRLLYYGLAAPASVSLAVVVLLASILFWYSYPYFSRYGFNIASTSWKPDELHPERSMYGLLTPLLGTLATSLIAIIVALPLSVSAVLLVEELLPLRVRGGFTLVVDMMAGVPTIVYGFWGLRVLAPWLRDHVYRPLHTLLGWLPLFSCEPLTGANTLTAGIVLAVMITPYMFAIIREAYHSIPFTYREAVLALGATRYEASRIMLSMVKPAIIARIKSGLIATSINL